jgi:hypothetical protein
MIPEPNPYDPDEPGYDDPIDDLAYLLPDRALLGSLADREDPATY